MQKRVYKGRLFYSFKVYLDDATYKALVKRSLEWKLSISRTIDRKLYAFIFQETDAQCIKYVVAKKENESLTHCVTYVTCREDLKPYFRYFSSDKIRAIVKGFLVNRADYWEIVNSGKKDEFIEKAKVFKNRWFSNLKMRA